MNSARCLVARNFFRIVLSVNQRVIERSGSWMRCDIDQNINGKGCIGSSPVWKDRFARYLKSSYGKRKRWFYLAAVAFTAGAAEVAFTTGATEVTFAAGAAEVAFTTGATEVTFAAGAAEVAFTTGATEVTFAAGAAEVAVITGAAVVGAAVGVAAGAWLVQPAKQAAMNNITNIVEINPTCTSLLIIIPGYMWTRTVFNVSFCSLKKRLNS